MPAHRLVLHELQKHCCINDRSEVSSGSISAGTGEPQVPPGTSADPAIPDAVAAAAQWGRHVP